MRAPDFVAVGHVTLDRFGDAIRPGGAALFAAVTAHRLGLSAAVLTSHGDDFPLDSLPSQIEVVSVPAASTTIFEHAAADGGRTLHVRAAAGPLGPADVPEDWADAGLVLLAPVLNEVDPMLADAFGGATVAAAAQGWLRRVEADLRIVPRPWEGPGPLLDRVQGLFLSREDVRADEDSVLEWFQRVPVGALTAGKEGAVLFVNGQDYVVQPRPSREVDETGAGDVFAAAFLVEYQRHGEAWLAAAAAACAAGLSVEAEGWTAVPNRRGLDSALAELRD